MGGTVVVSWLPSTAILPEAQPVRYNVAADVDGERHLLELVSATTCKGNAKCSATITPVAADNRVVIRVTAVRSDAAEGPAGQKILPAA